MQGGLKAMNLKILFLASKIPTYCQLVLCGLPCSRGLDLRLQSFGVQPLQSDYSRGTSFELKKVRTVPLHGQGNTCVLLRHAAPT